MFSPPREQTPFENIQKMSAFTRILFVVVTVFYSSLICCYGKPDKPQQLIPIGTLAPSEEETKTYQLCYPYNQPTMYQGRINVTNTGEPCISWESVSKAKWYNKKQFIDQKYPSNFCRVPLGHHDNQPYCYINEKAWDYCSVPVCADYVSCYPNNHPELYKGKLNVSATGKACVDWRLRKEESHLFIDGEDNPLNFCRAPFEIRAEKPRCVVDAENGIQENCDVPVCRNELQYYNIRSTLKKNRRHDFEAVYELIDENKRRAANYKIETDAHIATLNSQLAHQELILDHHLKAILENTFYLKQTIKTCTSHQVGFTAVPNWGSGGDGYAKVEKDNIVHYETINFNYGDGWTGSMFKCSIAGLYRFDLSVQGFNHGNAMLHIVKDDVIQTSAFAVSGSGNPWSSASTSAVLELEAGDDVWVQAGLQSLLVNRPKANKEPQWMNVNSFCGHLIAAKSCYTPPPKNDVVLPEVHRQVYHGHTHSPPYEGFDDQRIPLK